MLVIMSIMLQFVFARADFSGEFSLAIGGDQTVHNFSFDGMTDLCNPVGDGADLFDLIIYTDEASA